MQNNFKGDISLTDIILRINGKYVLALTLEVYPTKLSYKDDYEEILRDVNEDE